MQLYPGIVASLPVILVRILANLLVKLTKIRYRGGGHGGAYPSTRASSQTVCGVKLEHGVLGHLGVCGDSWRPTEGKKRLPLYDFRYSFPDFLGRRF